MTVEVIQPLYLIIDTSGSTARDRWIEACNSLSPLVVDALEQLQGQRGGSIYRLSLLTYATKASVQIGLTDLREIVTVPALSATGFSSLASAMMVLTELVSADLAQLQSDGDLSARPSATFIMHGLPTDATSELIATARVLDEASLDLCLHAVSPVGTDHLALRGLGFHRCCFVESRDACQALAPSVLKTILCDRLDMRPKGPADITAPSGPTS